MSQQEKLLQSIMSGAQDSSIKFDALVNLLQNMGFTLERISGSHHIFSYPGVMELIDLQPDKKNHSKAKGYQVKQVRSFFKRYLGV